MCRPPDIKGNNAGSLGVYATLNELNRRRVFFPLEKSRSEPERKNFYRFSQNESENLTNAALLMGTARLATALVPKENTIWTLVVKNNKCHHNRINSGQKADIST